MQTQCFQPKLGIQDVNAKHWKPNITNLGMWLCACMFVVTVRLFQVFSALSLISLPFFISLSFCHMLFWFFNSLNLFFSLCLALLPPLCWLALCVWEGEWDCVFFAEVGCLCPWRRPRGTPPQKKDQGAPLTCKAMPQSDKSESLQTPKRQSTQESLVKCAACCVASFNRNTPCFLEALPWVGGRAFSNYFHPPRHLRQTQPTHGLPRQALKTIRRQHLPNRPNTNSKRHQTTPKRPQNDPKEP